MSEKLYDELTVKRVLRHSRAKNKDYETFVLVLNDGVNNPYEIFIKNLSQAEKHILSNVELHDERNLQV